MTHAGKKLKERDGKQRKAVGKAKNALYPEAKGRLVAKTSREKRHRSDIPALRTKKIWRIEVYEGETAFTGDPQRPSEKCTGCMSCMAACALSKEGLISSECSGIRIHHFTNEWALRKAEKMYTYAVCRQCPGVPPCDEVCPVHAHYRDGKTGAVVIDHAECTRCGACVKACPYDACWFSPEHDKVYKCDLCHGRSEGPQCVTVCPSMILEVKAVV
jgi:Fe-S-cluster-containing dehydrogenase component